MKCQGKRWSLFGWDCEIVDRFSTLYWWRTLLSGTKPELCLWVILIEIAQFLEAGVWSGVWIPVVLGTTLCSGRQGPAQNFRSEVSFMTFPPQSMRSSGFLVPPKQPYCYTFILRTLLGAQKNLGAGFFCLTYLSLFSIPSFPLTVPSFPIKKEKPKPN